MNSQIILPGGIVLLHRQQAAERLGISVRKLSAMNAKHVGPMPMYYGKLVYFAKFQLDQYKAAIDNCQAPADVPSVVPDCEAVDGLASEKEAAKALGLSMRTLAYRRAHGLFPLPVQVGKQRMYRMQDLAQYLTFVQWKTEDWVS